MCAHAIVLILEKTKAGKEVSGQCYFPEEIQLVAELFLFSFQYEC